MFEQNTLIFEKTGKDTQVPECTGIKSIDQFQLKEKIHHFVKNSTDKVQVIVVDTEGDLLSLTDTTILTSRIWSMAGCTRPRYA